MTERTDYSRRGRSHPDSVAVGQVIGRWTVTGPYVRRDGGQAWFPCRCACGTERDVVYRQLSAVLLGTRSAQSGCGCGQLEHARRLRGSKYGGTSKDPGYARAKWLGQTYGLTLEQYDALVEEQQGCCPLCQRLLTDVHSAHVDHDHSCCPGPRSCGRCVRGVLCHGCNVALGLVQEDIETLRRAAEYLERAKVGA